MRVHLRFGVSAVQAALDAPVPEFFPDLVVLIPYCTEKYGEVSVGFVRDIVVGCVEAAVANGDLDVELPFDIPSEEDYAHWGLRRDGDLLVPVT